ncbi:hypothetical protein AD998_21470 [bacterium 336/3]|nr:hypothetical protein AD998_21470 [bacterium 336/3]
MKKLAILILILLSLKSYSQSFYVNTSDVFANGVYKFDISNNSEILQNNCSLGQIPDDFYTDMAIDKDSNTYYLSSWGDLYIKEFNGSCRFLGAFPTTGSVNALVADNNNFLYACGSEYINGVDVGVFYKYDLTTGVFSTIGILPPNFIPAGDLFFYNRKLFLACLDTSSITSCIIEIDMINPSQSRFYMASEDNVYGTFSINYGSYSKSYIISTDFIGSSLYELDMENRQVGGFIRSYDYIVFGAASTYDLTSTNATPNTLTVDLGEDINTCIGKEITLEAKTLPSQLFYTYQWNTGETNSQIIVKNAGIYWVDVTSPYGVLRDSIEIKLEQCEFDIFTSNQTGEFINACTEEEITLEVRLPLLLSSYPLKWSTGEINNKITIKEAGIYWAEITSPYGVFRDSIEIKEEKCIFIPNVFTPNNDGINDAFYIKGIKKGNWQLQIYDRRGLLVYENNTYKNDWNGGKLPVALYYYRLIREESREEYKGWVQILK